MSCDDVCKAETSLRTLSIHPFWPDIEEFGGKSMFIIQLSATYDLAEIYEVKDHQPVKAEQTLCYDMRLASFVTAPGIDS